MAHGKHYHFSFIYIYLSCACDSFLQTLRQAERLKMALKAMALSSICTSHRGSFGSTADDEWDELYVLSSFPPFASLPQRCSFTKRKEILEVLCSTPRKHRSSPRPQKLFAKESLEMWHQLSLESLAVRPVTFFTFFTTLSQRRCSDSCACNRRSKSSKAGGHRVPLDSVEITKSRSKFMLKSLERRGFQGVPV